MYLFKWPNKPAKVVGLNLGTRIVNNITQGVKMENGKEGYTESWDHIIRMNQNQRLLYKRMGQKSIVQKRFI